MNRRRDGDGLHRIHVAASGKLHQRESRIRRRHYRHRRARFWRLSPRSRGHSRCRPLGESRPMRCRGCSGYRGVARTFWAWAASERRWRKRPTGVLAGEHSGETPAGEAPDTYGHGVHSNAADGLSRRAPEVRRKPQLRPPIRERKRRTSRRRRSWQSRA